MSRGEGFLTLLLQQQGRSVGVSRLPEGLEYAQGAIQALHEIGDLSDQETAMWSRRFNDVAGYAPAIRPEGTPGSSRLTVTELSKAGSGDTLQDQEQPTSDAERLFEPQAFVRVVPIDSPARQSDNGLLRLLSIEIYRQINLIRWLFQPDFPPNIRGTPSAATPNERIAQLQYVAELVPQFDVSDNLGRRYQYRAARWHGLRVVQGETEFLPGIHDEASALLITLGDLNFTIRLS